MEKNMEISLLFDFYGRLLKDNQQTAVELYYNNDLSLSETALEMNITRQGVRDALKRAEQNLYSFESKLGLCKRFGIVENKLAKISQLSQSIAQDAENGCEIKKSAEEILRISTELLEQF